MRRVPAIYRNVSAIFNEGSNLNELKSSQSRAWRVKKAIFLLPQSRISSWSFFIFYPSNFFIHGKAATETFQVIHISIGVRNAEEFSGR